MQVRILSGIILEGKLDFLIEKYIMKNWYKKAQIDNDKYIASCRVNLHITGLPNNYDYELEIDTISIPFFIEMEHRDWGIKDINVHVMGVINVPFVINIYNQQGNIEKEISKEISVDLSKIKHYIRKESGIVTLGELDLYLDSNLNVDYSRSELDIIK